MATEQQDGVAGVHRYKLKPPTFNGDYAMYEEWRYKFQAYMCLQSTEHDRFMRESERATARIQDTDLEGAAATQEEADRWKQLSQEMKYILTSVTSGGAATVRRQNQHETGYEIRSTDSYTTGARSSMNKEHGILDKAIEANIRSKQLRRELLTLGL